MTYLWLDDDVNTRKPPNASSGVIWEWAKTADEAIEVLKKGDVVFASLDHDLADEHYQEYHAALREGRVIDTSKCKEKTGMFVLNWMEENDVWPVLGVRIHTMNPDRKAAMLAIVERVYGKTFQYYWTGTHRV